MIKIITKLLLKSDNTNLDDTENNYVYDCITKRRTEFSTDMFNTVVSFMTPTYIKRYNKNYSRP